MTNPTPADRADNDGRGLLPSGGMLVTIRVHDCEQPLDIYVDAVISINDQLTSLADADTLEPLKTDTRLREGRRTKQVAAEYDWSSKQARLPNGTLVPLTPGTLDLVSLFYSIRASELKLGALYQYGFLDANHRPKSVAVRVF